MLLLDQPIVESLKIPLDVIVLRVFLHRVAQMPLSQWNDPLLRLMTFWTRALLGAIVGLLMALLRTSKIQLDYERPPGGDAKRIILRAIKRSEKVLPLNAALRITRLSASRYHSWCRAEAGCHLDDQPSCPDAGKYASSEVDLSDVFLAVV